MELFKGIDPTLVNWVLIPILIFIARLIDVTLGTLRIVFISKGNKNIAPILGFVEVLIWLIAITQIMQNLGNWASYLGWAAGFAVGNYLGLILEEKLALGQLVIRVITQYPATELIEKLKEENFRTTCVDAHGQRGRVVLLFMIIRRKDLDRVIRIVKGLTPKAFYSIENVKSVSDNETFTNTENRKIHSRKLFPIRKGK